MSNLINPHAIQNMIAQDSIAINELKSLLIQERELLEQRQHDELPGIIARKDQLLDALAFNARQREALVKSAGINASANQWEILLSQTPATRALIEPWHLLKSEFGECKTLNDINGKMIGRSKQILGNLLNLLRGQIATPQLYTNTGVTTSTASSHCVAKA